MTSYIRLSRRGWVLAMNACIWYLIARVNHNLIALLLAWGSLAILGVSFIAAFGSLRRIRFRRAATPDAQVGKLTSLPIVCMNLKRRRRQPFILEEPLVFTDQGVCCTAVPPLPVNGDLLLERTIMPVRRGEYRLDQLVARDSDPAGLFLRERQISLPSSIVVYPATLPIRQLRLPPQETFNVSTAVTPISASGNSHEFYGVREYHPSDGMRHIHWRSSARCGRLMVREFERSAALSVALLLDADADALTPKTGANLETCVTLAASICRHLEGIYCTIGLAAGGAQAIAHQPQDAQLAMSRLSYELATIAPGKVSLAAAAEDVVAALPPHGIVFCFTLSDTPHLRDFLDTLVVRGLDVRWYLATAEAFSTVSGGRRGKSRRQPEAPATITGAGLLPVVLTPEMSTDEIFEG